MNIYWEGKEWLDLQIPRKMTWKDSRDKSNYIWQGKLNLLTLANLELESDQWEHKLYL